MARRGGSPALLVDVPIRHLPYVPSSIPPFPSLPLILPSPNPPVLPPPSVPQSTSSCPPASPVWWTSCGWALCSSSMPSCTSTSSPAPHWLSPPSPHCPYDLVRLHNQYIIYICIYTTPPPHHHHITNAVLTIPLSVSPLAHSTVAVPLVLPPALVGAAGVGQRVHPGSHHFHRHLPLLEDQLPDRNGRRSPKAFALPRRTPHALHPPPRTAISRRESEEINGGRRGPNKVL